MGDGDTGGVGDGDESDIANEWDLERKRSTAVRRERPMKIVVDIMIRMSSKAREESTLSDCFMFSSRFITATRVVKKKKQPSIARRVLC